MKSNEQAFIDWEGEAFGFGYGTGEMPILAELKLFLEALPAEGNYDHAVLEEEFGALTTWLLLNTLCHMDNIDYGSSTRYGWLSPSGVRLKEFVASKSSDELYEIVMSATQDHPRCYMNCCNCDGGAQDAKCANNPFF